MKIFRYISLFFSFLALALFMVVYFGTNHMQQNGYYDIGDPIWILGDEVRITAVLGVVFAIPGLPKRDRYAFIALGLSILSYGLLYATGWHAFVHHGV